MERTFNFEIETDTDNGYQYYVIPAGITLYRGDTTLYPHFQQPKLPAFFSTEAKFVKHYGILFRFITTEPMRLLALDNHANYRNFYNNSSDDIQTILRRNYGYKTGLRDSAYRSDFKLVNHLCYDLHMDGYANDRMFVDDMAVVDAYEGEEDMENRPFHPELALCKFDKVRYVNPAEDVQNYININGEKGLQKEFKRKQDSVRNWEEKERREQSRSRNNKRDHFGSPMMTSDLFSRMGEETTSDGNSSDSNSFPMGSLGNITDDTFSSPPSSPSHSQSSESAPGTPENPGTPGTPKNIPFQQGNILFQSPPKKPRRGGGKRKTRRKTKRKNKQRKTKQKGKGLGYSKHIEPPTPTPPEKTRKNVQFSPRTKDPSSPIQNKTQKMFISGNKDRQKAVTAYINRQHKQDLRDVMLGKKRIEGGRKSRKKKSTRKAKKTKKSKKHTKKRGGVSRSLANRPPTPPMSLPGTPVMDATMDNLQRYWIRPELYPRYINEAFAVIGDIDRIEALYREGELRYFFRTLIIDRFRHAIEYDRSNWELIVNNIRTHNTGRIVNQLRERNAMMSQIYQENIVTIGRMNPDSPITVRL